MSLFLLGLNHKTAPVAVRERMAFSPSRLTEALRLLRAHGAQQAAILSTCNRAEIYLQAPDNFPDKLHHLLPEIGGWSPSETHEIERHFYRAQDNEAARHLFAVASGIDSLVLGESEILGQVKAALALARDNGALGAEMDELLRRAIACGKRARTETAIGRGALNVGSAAVELARQIFGPLNGHTVLILGAGKMSALTAQHLVASGARRILVANRTYGRAQELARMFSDPDARQNDGLNLLNGIPNAQAEAVTWEEFPQKLAQADIVISSTRAPHLVLTAPQVEQAMRLRHQRPLFLIDIAVPRDIDPQSHQQDNVYLYDIDDLQGVVAANQQQRARELQLVQNIIGEETQSWTQWMKGRGAQPVLAALARHANDVRDRETEIAMAQLQHLSPRDQQIVRALARSVSGKLMHAPLRHLREAADSQPADVEALRRAFALETETSNDSASTCSAPADTITPTSPEVAR